MTQTVALLVKKHLTDPKRTSRIWRPVRARLGLNNVRVAGN